MHTRSEINCFVCQVSMHWRVVMRLGLIRDEKSRKMALENVIGVHTSGLLGQVCARGAHTWVVCGACVHVMHTLGRFGRAVCRGRAHSRRFWNQGVH